MTAIAMSIPKTLARLSSSYERPQRMSRSKESKRSLRDELCACVMIKCLKDYQRFLQRHLYVTYKLIVSVTRDYT